MAKLPIYNNRHVVCFLLLVISLTSRSTAEQPNAGEIDALRTIASDWGSSDALSSWSSGNWTGVTCDSNGHVTALSFPKSGIASSIPASVCSLKNLSSIDLSYNSLSGEFPAVLYGCSALQFLDLSNNGFNGSLPGDIDELAAGSLLHLNLSANGFAGDVPAAIARFPKLKSLLLDTNRFNGSYPAAAIGGMVGLETLTLASNPFMPGPVPAELGKLTKLRTLWLSEMNMTGGIPGSLAALTELTTLDMAQNKLQGTIPGWIWKLQKLEYLFLYDNNFTGVIEPTITAAAMLQVDLSKNKLVGPIPESVGNMKKLNLLCLYYNNIDGPIPASVGLLTNLADVRLFGNRLSGPLPPELGKHSPLGNLEVSNNLLSGELPETLCFNKQLYDLVVFDNSFSGVFPASLGECDTLNNIMAHNNRFAGDFPEKIWSFPKLTNIQIHDNDFTGALPTVISSNISRIEMENNRFSGDIPASASELNVFWAQNNSFSGALPASMAWLANLTDLNLAENRMRGSIPASIRLLGRLNSLNLSSNKMSGAIPEAIGSLPVLNILDLSGNSLTGGIPPEFRNLHLNVLNLSSNELSGEVPPSLQSPAYDRSFLGNRGLCSTANMNMNLPACGSGRRSMLSMGLTVVCSVLACAALIGAAAIGCLAIWWRKRREGLAVWKMTAFRAVDFSECDVITNLREENLIGSGGFGKVYRVHLRGRVAGAGVVVAVKKLWNTGKPNAKLDKEFDSEVKVLGDIRHNNIVSLLCCISGEDTKLLVYEYMENGSLLCCISGEDTKLLVYEYMENGSLDRWLHRRERAGTAPLDWPTRLAIAVDVARGLSYMHHESSQPIVHRDVKSSNILLDPSFRAKVADFGLARILVNSGEPQSVSAIGGTIGYMAPEYGYRAKVDEKVDVYSFGVVLLELTTGRVANDGRAECCLAEGAWRRYKIGGSLHDAVDEDILEDGTFLDDVVAVFILGVICTGDDPLSRPSMKDVLDQLLQYDRTASVGSACRDNCGDWQEVKKDGGQCHGKRSPASGVAWSGDEEDDDFVAHPV